MAYMQRESKIFQSIFDATRTGSYCFEIRTVSPCQTENYFLLFNFCASKSFEHFFFFLHEYMKQVTVSSESRKFNDDRTSVEFLQRRDKIRSFTRGK